MTPKEKAEQLIHRMMYKIQWSKVKYHTLMEAKDCSLIAVDEISKCTKYEKQKFDNDRFSEQYWQEVKQEIENL